MTKKMKKSEKAEIKEEKPEVKLGELQDFPKQPEEAEEKPEEKEESAHIVDGADLVEKKPDVETYTYVGAGAEPPEVINFMGMQRFVRGEETEVTIPQVLAKIKNNQCFVKGKADPVKMFEDKQAAQAEVERKRQRDNQLQNAEARRNQKFR